MIRFALILFVAAFNQDGGKMPWKKDPVAAIAEAKKSGKPMMIFFTSQG